MIESVSERLSSYIYRHNDRGNVSEAVMKYALIGILTNGMTIVLSLAIGAIGGKFEDTVIALAAMAVMRYLTGGHHLESPALCIVVSTLAVVIVPYIPMNSLIIYICTGISAIMIIAFAPANLKNKTRITDKALQVMKVIGLFLVLSNALVLSPILAVAFTISSLSLISKKEVNLHE